MNANCCDIDNSCLNESALEGCDTLHSFRLVLLGFSGLLVTRLKNVKFCREKIDRICHDCTLWYGGWYRMNMLFTLTLSFMPQELRFPCD